MDICFRFEQITGEKDMALKNIGADMAINQFLTSLPEGCVTHKTWKDKHGNPFPDYKSMETYVELLEQTTQPPQSGNGDESEDTSQDKKTANGERNAKKK
jgi:predicted metal-dependent peptidase